MKLIPRILIATLILTWTINVSAQTPDELVKTFFSEYRSEGAAIALKKLYETNNWISRNQDGINKLIGQLASYNEELIGEYYGYEAITKKSLGESYVLMSYLVKFDRQPLRFTFQFYKPKDQWVLYSFKFDDSFDDELERAAEIYMLPESGGN
ncbi:MAG: hypothetical protein HEP71_10665 [Roseivirga sp.]|nr:hypothetical protein [Roseivirga sp.]